VNGLCNILDTTNILVTYLQHCDIVNHKKHCRHSGSSAPICFSCGLIPHTIVPSSSLGIQKGVSGYVHTTCTSRHGICEHYGIKSSTTAWHNVLLASQQGRITLVTNVLVLYAWNARTHGRTDARTHGRNLPSRLEVSGKGDCCLHTSSALVLGKWCKFCFCFSSSACLLASTM
jgi:hypothetical protein